MQDGFYMLPRIEELMQMVYISQISKLKFNGELMDCDDYSLLLNASIKRQRIDISFDMPAEDSFHWSFGEAFGDKFNRVEELHTICVCAAQEGIYLIEPQTYEYWITNPKNDNVLIIKM
jgi:hypothetical protein